MSEPLIREETTASTKGPTGGLVGMRTATHGPLPVSRAFATATLATDHAGINLLAANRGGLPVEG
ncbi:hypothetical protein EV641_10678 [Rhodococcus sp. SMB37]|uniref:hypothetical protein n=1 Tax=Rhodococcus sp. SMB37 TaxID=2512213 RepID=UPI001045E26F|nr:hypothetical protein [Rhodococcus sp. SMB37]TCN53434.1 hypothetical protein EV641_10678 [Rhodococcus sp. SMB37]